MSLANSRLRRHANEAFRSALAAVRPAGLITSAVRVDGSAVEVCGEAVPAVAGQRVVAAIGKAAPGLAAAWLERLPHWADRVFVLTAHGVPVDPALERQAVVRRGAHPFPDAAGEAAARELLGAANELGADDLLVVLLSGGGSALLATPEAGLSLDDVTETTRRLLASGAPIGAVNTVRREILAAGGGGLARAAAPARVLTLVLSDVLGDPLPDIASGPTVLSPTGADDALAVFDRYGVREAVPPAVVELLLRRARGPAGVARDWAERTRTVVLANNATAVEAAACRLEALGYGVQRSVRPLVGEASARGRQIGALAVSLEPREDLAVVYGGETTVTVHGTGRGGRNQELALAAALEIRGRAGRVVLSAGTDGIDGLTDHAGAIVDGTTIDRIVTAGFEPRKELVANNSGPALAAAGDALITGATGTNVCDLTLLLASANGDEDHIGSE